MNEKDIEKLIKGLLKGDFAKEKIVMHRIVKNTYNMVNEIFDEFFKEGSKKDRRNFLINFAINMYGNTINMISPNDKVKMKENFDNAQKTLDKWIENCIENIEENKKHCGDPDCENHDD